MSTRRRAREVAMQALFRYDVNPTTSPEEIDAFLSGRLHFPELETFCRSLVDGVRSNRQAIDATITDALENWRMGRLAPVDRNVLRLAVYELTVERGNPVAVVINESLEICRRYSSAESVAFANGVLDRIASQLQDKTTEGSDETISAATEEE
ncbi:hypothetical protein Pan216_16980 [Planctomycetes bacterium Pan216]|uniref:Transcription antitermination protein NusB n=1 Tax=Kolteria novifilia TaxID=2527975 RepID=A0A518B1Q0_9BACT|nr:hypothetical protein Pan216_16980 [Planctomycetes bacterium Pan216]